MRTQLIRNSLANFAGLGLPNVVTVVAVPIIIHHLGDTTYGVLSLVAAIVGYFSIIDVNVTAGSVKFLAEFHSRGEPRRMYEVVTLGLLVYFAIGAVGGTSIVLAAPWLITHAFQIPVPQREAATLALRLGGAGFLFGQLQFYMQSIPQSVQRYDVSAGYEAAFGMLGPLLTIFVVITGGGLVAIVALRLALSIVNVLLLGRRVRGLLPQLSWCLPERRLTRQVLGFSGFAYLRNIAAVTYAQADKLIIGALAGAQALAWYAVPFTLISRVFSMVGRLGSVLFPAASALAAQDEMDRLRRIYLVAVRYTTFINSGLAVALWALAHNLLSLWIGREFAQRSGTILALLAISALLDSITNLPTVINDGLGHPRVTGFFAMIRAAMGVGIAYLLVGRLGVVGAAIGQLVVSTVMTIAFVAYVHDRTVPAPLLALLRHGLTPALASTVGPGLLGWWLAGQLGGGVLPTLAVGAVMAALMALLGYRYVLRTEDKAALFKFLLPTRLA